MEERVASQSWLWACFFVVGTAVTFDAQTPKPTFEVASVKKRDQSDAVSTFAVAIGATRRLEGGLFAMPSTTVSGLIQFAFDVRDDQLSGGPDWIRKDLFEISARPAGEASREQMRLMVQALLEDRFKLALRREQREMRILELVLARSDGKLGPNMHLLVPGSSDPLPIPRDTPTAAVRISGRGTMSGIANMLSRRMEVPVIDRTSVTGTFYYIMFTTPEGRRPDPGLPSLTTALHEQLGLKLESTRGQVDVLVIDSVQQPTEN
jgi:uncharacterized protein (TIGR03435 family)